MYLVCLLIYLFVCLKWYNSYYFRSLITYRELLAAGKIGKFWMKHTITAAFCSFIYDIAQLYSKIYPTVARLSRFTFPAFHGMILF